MNIVSPETLIPERVYFGVPVEYRGDILHQKTTSAELSFDVVCMILHLAFIVQHLLVTDTNFA